MNNMLNPKAYLIADVLKKKSIVEKPTRDGFGEGLVIAARKNPEIVGLCADLTESTRMLDFKKAFPDRFIQMGVHEQLLAAMGAGLALAGKVPFITSYAMFCPGRAWEQVRTNICLNNVNVKIIGSHAGVSVGPDGATHQAIEDMAIMRPIPNMTIVAPCDMIEAKKATQAIADFVGPSYLRLAREKTPIFTTEKTPFTFGKATTLREGTDVAIIGCGPLLFHALVAAEQLAKEGINTMVINMHTIKPLDEEAILSAAKKCGAIVSVEEHQIAGGLGSAVAEVLAKNLPTPMEFIGMKNQFGESGEPEELVEYFGMGSDAIKKAVKKVFQRRNR